ncbi:CPBP family intramembrane glutamic endopeptidase [Methanobrevibacter sp.]
MSLFNEKLKQISLKEVISLIIVLFVLIFVINELNIFYIDPIFISVIVICYILYKIQNFSGLKQDIIDAFSLSSIKYILLMVVLNIFLSYGLLYLSNSILTFFPSLNFLVYFSRPLTDVVNSIVISSFVATVFISPVFEELFFRGILINRLNLIVPTLFSILISSLLFASLHTFGNITSAFVFSICMAILYIKTDNIVVAISAHFLNNFIAESIVILDVNNLMFTSDVVMGCVSFLAVVSAILLIVSIVKELNKIK